MAKYAKKLSVGISLFLCSTNCMLLNTVHRGRWEYIARSIIDIIIIISIIIVIIIAGVIAKHNYWLLQQVLSFGCNHNVLECFWQEQWLITAKQLRWQYDLSWCMMVDVVRKSSCFHTSLHGVSVLSGLIAVFTKIIF